MLKPHMQTLPEPQLYLWKELKDTPNNFVLYGGTALALRFEHRVSVDFDFFSSQPFRPDELYRTIPYLKKSEKIQSTTNTLTCIVQRAGGPIKITFLGGLDFGRVSIPDKVYGPEILIASLLDLAATKIKVIQDRAESKDYFDIACILDNGITLYQTLGAALGVFGDLFNPMISLRALTFFQDGDLNTLDKRIQKQLMAAVKSIDIQKLHKTPQLSKNLAIETIYNRKT